jgi:hypothetical protein
LVLGELNSGPVTCWTTPVPLEPQLQSLCKIFVLEFFHLCSSYVCQEKLGQK